MQRLRQPPLERKIPPRAPADDALDGAPPLAMAPARRLAVGRALEPAGLAPDAYPAAIAAGTVPIDLRYASFGARAVAAVVDFVIVQCVAAFLDSLFVGALLDAPDTTGILTATVGPLLAGGAFALFYCVWLESSPWQATPGKRLLGLKVTDVSGQRIGFGRACSRNFAKGLSLLTCGLGYLMPLWSRRRQCLHDVASGCLVVRAAS